MKKIVVLGLTLLLCACSYSTVPTRRSHVAAGIPRLVDLPSPISEAGLEVIRVKIGSAYSLAWSDVGNVHNSNIFYVGGMIRTEHVSFGLTPFYSVAKVSHDGTANFGSLFSATAFLLKNKTWNLSPQLSFATSIKVFEEKGCTDATFTIFGSSCTPASSYSRARAEIKVKELGVLLPISRHIGEKEILVISPGAYYSMLVSGNALQIDSVNDYVRNSYQWNPALQVHYARSGVDAKSFFWAVGAGIVGAKSFTPGKEKRYWMPTADVKFQF